MRLDDVQLVGDDVAAHIFEISHCDARCINATAFAIALGKRLQHYLDNPVTADGARAELRERVAWWRIALSRAGDLARWPALVLNNRDRQNG